MARLSEASATASSVAAELGIPPSPPESGCGGCTSGSEAIASFDRHLGFCNGTKPHSPLGGHTPGQASLDQLPPIPAAA